MSLSIETGRQNRVSWAMFDNAPSTPPPEIATETLQSDSINQDSTPVVAVIGCGYVGSHLVEIFGQHFDVIAFDVSESRMKVFSEECKYWPGVQCTTTASDLIRATHFLISVPTLLTADKKSVDTSYVRSAIATVMAHARTGATIVIESSVAVGMTRSLLESLVTERGLMAGMSPERVDPGRTWPALENVPKIISGLTPEGLESIKRIYDVAFNNLVCVSSPEVAEMTKLYENCQRMVCIAFANEMSDACAGHNIDPYEVSRAAATKPFGFMPFTPSMGVGGHCIPVNPSYLFTNNNLPVLKLANDRMQARPAALADQLITKHTRPHTTAATVPTSRMPRVLVIGTAFKPGQSVISCSPTIMFAHRAQELGAHVEYIDPLVQQHVVPTIPKLQDSLFTAQYVDENFDLVVLGMKQVGLDYSVLDDLESAKLESFVDMYQPPQSAMRRESRCR